MCMSLPPRPPYGGSWSDWGYARSPSDGGPRRRTGDWADGRSSPEWGSGIRASDAEREEVAQALGQHYADGRLNDTEFRERLDGAFAAVTRGDLYALVSDLPAKLAPPIPRRRPTFVPLLVVAVLVAVALTVATEGLALPILVALVLISCQSRRGPRRRPALHTHSGPHRH